MPINPNSPAAQKEYHKKRNQTGKLITFPSKPHPHGMLMVFKKYNYRSVEEGYPLLKNTLRSATGRSAGVELAGQAGIQLPFPLGLVDNTSLRINNFQRDPLTESLAAAAKPFLQPGGNSMSIREAGGLAFGGLKNLLNGIEGVGKDMASGNSPITARGIMDSALEMGNKFLDTDLTKLGAAAAYLLRSNLPGDLGSQVDAVLGSAINPREALAFQGVDMKTHSFSWEMYPSNRTDSLAIKNIVNMLKSNSLPSVEDLSLGSGDNQVQIVAEAFLNYPAVVDIYLLGVNEEHFMKFKTCMVTNFTVDYGASETGMLQGGKPVAVNLGIQLAELAIHTANDYAEGLDAPETEAQSTSGEEVQDTAAATGGSPGLVQ